MTLLENQLLSLSKQYQWDLEAWAVFANHLHFIARNDNSYSGGSLKELIGQLHADTARELNRLDNEQGRTVWYNFQDTRLTFQESYLARVNYVHQNPVKHGLVAVAKQYQWCSAAWFERVASQAVVKTIYSFKIDKLNVYDAY